VWTPTRSAGADEDDRQPPCKRPSGVLVHVSVPDGNDPPRSARPLLLRALPGAALRFDLRVTATWLALALSSGRRWRSRSGGTSAAWPALPLLALSFSSNADLLWRRSGPRPAYAPRPSRAFEQRGPLDVRGVREHVDRPNPDERVARTPPAALPSPRAVVGCRRRRRRAAPRAAEAAKPCRETARGGSTITTSDRLPVAQLAQRIATVACEERCVPIEFSSAFSIAQATDSSTPRSPHGHRIAGSERPIVPIPQ